MKNIYLSVILLSTLLTQGELLMSVNTHAGNIEITLSGSADISGLTPETRSGTAFFGESGLIFGNPPDPTDPLAGLQSYNAFALDAYPAGSYAAPAPAGLFDNWLRDPALSYSASTAPIGFFYGDQFETPDPTDTYGELYLPIGYLSGTELSGSLTLTNRTLADFGWVGGESWSFSWNAGQDSLTLNVVPEPTTLASILCATLGLQAFRSMQRNPRELRRKAPPPL